MTADISRHSLRPAQKFTGVVRQQGRLPLDSDETEDSDLGALMLRQMVTETICERGSPDDGFRISAPVVVANQALNFTIAPGAFYLGGSRLASDGDQYLDQPDWLSVTIDNPGPAIPAANTQRTDLVWLSGWEQTVTATEDSELFERALGGPDTTARRRMMWRVRVLAGTPDECGTAFADLVTREFAGGPLDKSWLLIVAYALRTANLDLRTDTTQVFGAPPLLAEKAKQGEIDAVLNFWPYAARLEAAGFKQLIGIEDVVSELGAKGEVAMVGYVFSESWANDNLKAVDGFLRAAAKADELLATSNEAWEAVRPLMRAEDQATFEALRRRYREGIPERSIAENESDAKVLYQFLRELGGEKLVGPGAELAPGTFWKGGKS